jgi:hypothetical protein
MLSPGDGKGGLSCEACTPPKSATTNNEHAIPKLLRIHTTVPVQDIQLCILHCITEHIGLLSKCSAIYSNEVGLAEMESTAGFEDRQYLRDVQGLV